MTLLLALAIAAAALLVVVALCRAASRGIRRIPDSGRLTRRQRRALADHIHHTTKPGRHLRLVGKKQ